MRYPLDENNSFPNLEASLGNWYSLSVINLKHETAKLLAEASHNIAKMIAGSAFEFWQRKDFRLYVDFGNISQTEQDRMFNELEVSLLGLFMVQFDNAVETAKEEEKKLVFKSFQKDLPSAFLQLFVENGVEKKYIDIWKKLINMRLKEYRADLKTAIKESSKWKEFQSDREEIKIQWARIETITIDCLSHLRRGEVKKDDPLWKLLRKWFVSLDTKISPMINL